MKSHLGRRAFSHMELHTLFNGYIYGDEKQPREQPKHWHFWLPLFSYYTGAYSDELARLTLSDIKSYQRVHGIALSSHQKLGSRFIPIHNGLWEAGFEDYLKFVQRSFPEQSDIRIFYDLPEKTGRYSEKVRIWFSGEGKRLGYLQKCGLPNIDQQGRKTAISSLRLNFEEQLRIAAIQAGSKSAFNYILGFKQEDDLAQYEPDLQQLKRICGQIRVINKNISWERFKQRH